MDYEVVLALSHLVVFPSASKYNPLPLFIYDETRGSSRGFT